MLNLPLKHLALSVEHAKSQLVYQDMLRRRKKLNLSKLLEVLNNPDNFEVEDIELVGQTDDEKRRSYPHQMHQSSGNGHHLYPPVQ